MKETDKVFLKIADWPLKTVNKFISYLEDYEHIPNYKKVLTSMIDAGQMYQPLRGGSLKPDISGERAALNSERRAQRAQIYMNKIDIIETLDPKEGKTLVLTSRGHKIYYQHYPLARLRKEKWDKVWTLVMYDFPEKIRSKRQVFRKRLVRYGFGSPQISILVSPLSLAEPVKELIDGEKLERFVWVTKSRGILGMNDQDVAKVSWPLDELNDLYAKLLDVLPKVNHAKDRELVKEGWSRFFLAVNFKDPHLPPELLPKDWLGEKCRYQLRRFSLPVIIRSIFD